MDGGLIAKKVDLGLPGSFAFDHHTLPKLL
jgi:hypothetical protein